MGRRGTSGSRQLPCIANALQIEYLVVCYDDSNHKVRLSLRQADILAALATDEKLLKQGGGVPDVRRGEEKFVSCINIVMIVSLTS